MITALYHAYHETAKSYASALDDGDPKRVWTTRLAFLAARDAYLEVIR